MVESALNNYGDWIPTQENAQKSILCNDNKFIMEKWFNG